MSYDDASKVTVIQNQNDIDQVKHKNAMDHYQAESGIVIQSIADSKKTLDDLLNQVIIKKQELTTLANQKIEDLNSQIGILLAQIEQKKAESLDLDKEIINKIGRRDSILSDFSSQQEELDNRKIELGKQANQVTAIQKVNDEVKAQLILDRQQFESQEKLSQKYLQDRDDMITQRENNINAREAKVASDILSNQAIVNQQQSILKSIGDKQTSLDATVLTAQPILAQADALVAKEKELKVKEDSVNAAQAQAALDIAQIKTTQQAQANKQAELRDRESAVQAAEAKIAGGR